MIKVTQDRLTFLVSRPYQDIEYDFGNIPEAQSV